MLNGWLVILSNGLDAQVISQMNHFTAENRLFGEASLL